jgi:integrase
MARGSVTKLQRRGKNGVEYTVWRARVPAGETGDGKRRQLTKVLPTRKAADAWVNEQLARTANGETLMPEVTTVGELLDRWLTHRARSASPASVRVDRWAVSVIAPEIGAIRVDKITVLRIQAFYDGLDGRLTPRSIKQVHRVLRSAFDRAVAWEIRRTNPATGTVRPGITRRAPAAWSAADAQRFLDETKDDFDGSLFALLLTTGLRIGEAIALDWRHVDLQGGTLSVERTMTYDRRGAVVVGARAKTDASHRRVGIPLPAQAALTRQLVAQVARRADIGEHWQEVGCVFDNGDGRRRSIGAARKRLAAIVSSLGLPYLSPHGLRHTTATLLFARRVPAKLIQDLLGHGSITVTSDTYIHVTDASRAEVTREIERALDGAIHDNGDTMVSRIISFGPNTAQESHRDSS